jgi:hypothetical protein
MTTLPLTRKLSEFSVDFHWSKYPDGYWKMQKLPSLISKRHQKQKMFSYSCNRVPVEAMSGLFVFKGRLQTKKENGRAFYGGKKNRRIL